LIFAPFFFRVCRGYFFDWFRLGACFSRFVHGFYPAGTAFLWQLPIGSFFFVTRGPVVGLMIFLVSPRLLASGPVFSLIRRLVLARFGAVRFPIVDMSFAWL